MAQDTHAIETGISLEELQLAARNHGMPLEALRYDVTPLGLHYLLTHYDVPPVDASSWRLDLGGRVRRPMSLSLDDIGARPAVTAAITFECAGNGRAQLSPRPISQPWLAEAVGTGEWTGTPLAGVLEEAGVQPDAVDVVFTGLDHGMEGEVEQDFERSLALADAMGPDVLLAYELNGVPLPPQHGFPLRLVVPGWYGMTNVKWLRRIRVTDRPFEGYQQAHGYRMRTDEEDRGTPLSRMAPRALMAPPGFPEFLSRRRLLRPGRATLEGRAWSGWAPVSSVEVSVDGGATWNEAELQRTRPWPAWVRWSFGWDAAAPGEYELCCRARDEAGNAQPDEPPWNVGGYSNNAIQRVPVTVLGQAEPTGTSD